MPAADDRQLDNSRLRGRDDLAVFLEHDVADVAPAAQHFAVRPRLINVRVVELFENPMPTRFIHSIDCNAVPGAKFACFTFDQGRHLGI